jgi:hypothetical protein
MRNNGTDTDMTTFVVLPVGPSADRGWVVKTTHGNGAVETSFIYQTQAQAQTAADGWSDLDEDWARV